jgi:hypothetical protein
LTVPQERPLEVERARQVFRFLKEFAERTTIAPQTLSKQLWHLPLRTLPEHPAIQVGEVSLADRELGEGAGDDSNDALLRVRRPATTTCPPPSESIREFLKKGWEDPAREVETYASRSVNIDDETIEELLGDDGERVRNLERWIATRARWAEKERPNREAMHVFERLYELNARLEREGERVELLLGDGRLVNRSQHGLIDHPLLLQRVALSFDRELVEFTLQDSERAPELYAPIT